MRATALCAAIGLAIAQAPQAAAQAANGAAPPKMSQVIRVYDATLSYPPPIWVKSEDDLLNSSSVYPEQSKNTFVQEQIRKTETLANWTEMLKIVGYHTADAQKIGVQRAVEASIAGYHDACEKGTLALQTLHEDAASALFVVLCGNTPDGPKDFGYGDGVGEISVARLFIVKDTIVQVQYGWRGAKFDIENQATYPVAVPTITRAADLLATAKVI